MSTDEQGMTPEAGQELPISVVAERMRQARDLADMTVAGAVSTVNSMAEMASAEAASNAEAAAEATQEVSEAVGKAVAGVVQAASVTTGAFIGGAKGALGGLILAAQISGGALMEATRGLAGTTARTAGAVTEGLVIATQDQEQGADSGQASRPNFHAGKLRRDCRRRVWHAGRRGHGHWRGGRRRKGRGRWNGRGVQAGCQRRRGRNLHDHQRGRQRQHRGSPPRVAAA